MKAILQITKSTKILSLILLVGLFGYAQQDPFNCDYNAYLFQYNDVYALDLASGNSYLVKGDIAPGSLNAVGYNPKDGYIWASLSTPAKTIVKIGKNFQVETFYIDELPDTNRYVGDVSSEGIYYLKGGGKTIYKIDLNPNSENYGNFISQENLSETLNIHDWAFNAVDGHLYAVEKRTNHLYRINSTTNNISDLGEVPVLKGLNYTYGAVYFDKSGRFYVSANQTGTVYVIQNVQTLEPNSQMDSNLFAFGPSSASNDGARCPTAPVPQEDCANGIDDDGDGLSDCDDPACSGIAACPIIAPQVSTGNSGGLESNDRLSIQINKRNYLRSKANYVFNKLNAKKITKSKSYKKAVSKNSSFKLQDLIPMDVIPETQAIESSATDLINITNATELFSVDYIKNDKTIAVVLATKTENGVYEHTKYICDRLLGAELLAVSTIEIKEQTFIKSIIKNADGSKEFVLSFSGKVTNNDSNFEIESHWNIDKYEENATFYNFQIWTNSIDDLITLGEEALDLLNTQRAISSFNNSAPPAVFVKKGSYKNGNLELVLINKNRTQNITFDAGFKRTETSATEYSNTTIPLNGNYISTVVIETGNIFDIGFRLENENNQTPDDLFMSDGPWGVDDSSEGTTLNDFTISQNDNMYTGSGYRVERNISLEATTSTYVAAYRAFTPKFNAVNLAEHKVLELDASGTGDLEIAIIKEGIDVWENQFKTTIKLTDSQTHYAIPLEFFKAKNGTNIELSDAVSMVFTMSSNGTDVVEKKMKIENIEFTQKVLSIDNQIIQENETLLYPNPMNFKTTIRFYSEIETETKIQVYNTAGFLVKKVTIETFIGNNEIEIFKKELSSGLYFIKISNNYRNYEPKKLLIN